MIIPVDAPRERLFPDYHDAAEPLEHAAEGIRYLLVEGAYGKFRLERLPGSGSLSAPHE